MTNSEFNYLWVEELNVKLVKNNSIVKTTPKSKTSAGDLIKTSVSFHWAP